MSWTLLVRAQAERDMEAAKEWYDEKRIGLGDEFLDEIASAIRRLESNPEARPLYFRQFRRILLRRFPYKVFYQIIGNRIVIFRVLHAK